jgi:hypothetical protein
MIFSETHLQIQKFASTDHHGVTCLFSAYFFLRNIEVCFASRILLEEFAVSL